jgi:hypothetical protein
MNARGGYLEYRLLYPRTDMHYNMNNNKRA